MAKTLQTAPNPSATPDKARKIVSPVMLGIRSSFMYRDIQLFLVFSAMVLEWTHMIRID